jgi:hypothetical protein
MKDKKIGGYPFHPRPGTGSAYQLFVLIRRTAVKETQITRITLMTTDERQKNRWLSVPSAPRHGVSVPIICINQKNSSKGNADNSDKMRISQMNG